METTNSGYYDFGNVTIRKAPKPLKQFDNSNLCGECTGAGCVRCYDQRGLLELGTVRFPRSGMVSDCKPPAILHTNAYKHKAWRGFIVSRWFTTPQSFNKSYK